MREHEAWLTHEKEWLVKLPTCTPKGNLADEIEALEQPFLEI
jgi:hypothetical protein